MGSAHARARTPAHLTELISRSSSHLHVSVCIYPPCSSTLSLVSILSLRSTYAHHVRSLPDHSVATRWVECVGIEGVGPRACVHLRRLIRPIHHTLLQHRRGVRDSAVCIGSAVRLAVPVRNLCGRMCISVGASARFEPRRFSDGAVSYCSRVCRRPFRLRLQVEKVRLVELFLLVGRSVAVGEFRCWVCEASDAVAHLERGEPRRSVRCARLRRKHWLHATHDWRARPRPMRLLRGDSTGAAGCASRACDRRRNR